MQCQIGRSVVLFFFFFSLVALTNSSAASVVGSLRFEGGFWMIVDLVPHHCAIVQLKVRKRVGLPRVLEVTVRRSSEGGRDLSWQPGSMQG